MQVPDHRPKVVVSNWVHQPVLDMLQARCRVEANQSRTPWSKSELEDRCADADGLIAFMTDRIDDAFLAACPNLKVVACALKGADNFDVEACDRRGVALTIVPDLLTAPTAELAVGLMIALGRNIVRGDAVLRTTAYEGWRPVLYGRGLDGSAVGIVGLGAVGRSIAHRLRPFRCALSYFDPRPLSPAEEDGLGVLRVDLPDLLAGSDYVVLAMPLTQETHHLIDRDALARMKPGALLVNPARGSLVDECAVADALETGHLAGYAADVFECEDWARAERPDGVEPRLLNHSATVLTPHIGSAVDRTRLDIAMSAARDALAILDGRCSPRQINRPSQTVRA